MTIPKTDREYRDMMLRIVEDEEEKKVTGYATTFNQRYLLWQDDEVRIFEEVSPDAFAETDLSDVIMQYNHEGRVFARVSNGTLTVTPDEHGLLIDADLGGTTLGRQLYEEIRGGYTDKMSFGFTVTGEEQLREDVEGEPITVTRRITRIGKLYDVSAVSLPANPNTEITARTKEYCDGVIATLAEECRRKEAEDHKAQQRAQLAQLLQEVKNHD
jgi:HK97 family phage prohead protease